MKEYPGALVPSVLKLSPALSMHTDLYVKVFEINISWYRCHQDPSLQWRHNEHDGVSNHQSHDCLFNRLFRRRSKKTSKLRVTGLRKRNSLVTGEFPSQRPVTWKIFPFDDVIMPTISIMSCDFVLNSPTFNSDCHAVWSVYYSYFHYHHCPCRCYCCCYHCIVIISSFN